MSLNCTKSVSIEWKIAKNNAMFNKEVYNEQLANTTIINYIKVKFAQIFYQELASH